MSIYLINSIILLYYTLKIHKNKLYFENKSKAFSNIVFKRMNIMNPNFLTCPNYQKQKFWKKLNSNFLPHPPRRGVLKTQKILNLVVEPKLLNMISYKHKDKKKSKK